MVLAYRALHSHVLPLSGGLAGALAGVAMTATRVWTVRAGARGLPCVATTSTQQPGHETVEPLHGFEGTPGNICAATPATIYVANQLHPILAEYDCAGREQSRLLTSAPAKFIDARNGMVVLGSPRGAPCVIQTVDVRSKACRAFALQDKFIESLCLMDGGNILVSHCDVSAPFAHMVQVLSPSGRCIRTLPVHTQDTVWETRVHRCLDGKLLLLNVTVAYGKEGCVYSNKGDRRLGRVQFGTSCVQAPPCAAYELQESFSTTQGNQLLMGFAHTPALETYFIS